MYWYRAFGGCRVGSQIPEIVKSIYAWSSTRIETSALATSASAESSTSTCRRSLPDTLAVYVTCGCVVVTVAPPIDPDVPVSVQRYFTPGGSVPLTVTTKTRWSPFSRAGLDGVISAGSRNCTVVPARPISSRCPLLVS